MARDILPQTPTRRSKRFQPLATPSKNRFNPANCTWKGDPIYTRPLNPEIDLLLNEKEARDALEEEEREETDTLFFDALELTCQHAKVYRAPKQPQQEPTTTFRVGDTVFIKTDEIGLMRRPPSVAVIVAMWQTQKHGESWEHDPSQMRIRVHWFLRPTEMAGCRAKRECSTNEIFYSIGASDILFPEVLVSHCTVSSVAEKDSHAHISTSPSKSSPKKGSRTSKLSDQTLEEKSLLCQYAIDSRRGLFFNFSWEKHHSRALQYSLTIPQGYDPNFGSGASWAVQITKTRTKPSAPPKYKKRRLQRETPESDADDNEDGYQPVREDSDESGDEDDILPETVSDSQSDVESADSDLPVLPRTPSKNRKRKRAETASPTKTPRKPRQSRTVIQPTPHSKAVLSQRSKTRLPGTPSRKRRRMVVRPLQRGLGTQLGLLRLPNDGWLRAIHLLHVGARPDVLPCREQEYEKVIGCIGDLLEEGSGGCVYISGVPGTGKTATVHTVVRELKRMAENNETNPFTFVEINGLKLHEPTAAYNLLWEAVSGHDVASEGHLQITAKESLKELTRYFNGGGGRGRGPGGHACVVLMDELDQLVTTKQDVVYNFFNWPTLVGSKLIVIAVANTMDLPERVMSGRVRSRLGMIRINFQPYTTPQLREIVQARLDSSKEGLSTEEGKKTVIAEDAIKYAAMKVSNISGDARRILDICRRAVELVQSQRRAARTADVSEVYQMMQNSPTAAYLRQCSFHERLMLASLVKCIKREGVEEIKWGEIQHQHLVYMNVVPTDKEPTRKPTPAELVMVLESLAAARAVVVEEGTAVMWKPEGERRVLLNIEIGEVERVLSDVGGKVWKSILLSG